MPVLLYIYFIQFISFYFTNNFDHYFYADTLLYYAGNISLEIMLYLCGYILSQPTLSNDFLCIRNTCIVENSERLDAMLFALWEDHFYISPPHVPNPPKTGALDKFLKGLICTSTRFVEVVYCRVPPPRGSEGI